MGVRCSPCYVCNVPGGLAPRGGGGAVLRRRSVIESLRGHRIEIRVGVRCSPCYACHVPAGALLCFLLCPSSLDRRDSGQTSMRARMIPQRHESAWAPRSVESGFRGRGLRRPVPRGNDASPSETHYLGTTGSRPRRSLSRHGLVERRMRSAIPHLQPMSSQLSSQTDISRSAKLRDPSH